MLLKQKKVNCHKCGVNFIWQANQFNQQKSVKRFQENTKRFQENTKRFQEHTLRRKTTVSSFILRSAAAVCSSESEQTVALPSSNRPHPYPSLPLVEFLLFLLGVSAKLVTEGLYQIGQMDLDTACFAVEDGHLAPKFYQMSSGCWNLKTHTWVPSRINNIGIMRKNIVSEAWEGSIWMHSVPLPRVGILGAVLLLISYFIVFLLFRRKMKHEF